MEVSLVLSDVLMLSIFKMEVSLWNGSSYIQVTIDLCRVGYLICSKIYTINQSTNVI